MQELGLTHLSVSVDTADEATFAMLTGGAKLEIVFRNVRSFCESCPDVTVQFIATISKANIVEIPKLVEKGLEVGAHRFHFREMFHIPGGNIVDDQKLQELVLPPGQFLEMQEEVEKLFAGQAGFFFGKSNNLVAASKAIKTESYAVAT